MAVIHQRRGALFEFLPSKPRSKDASCPRLGFSTIGGQHKCNTAELQDALNDEGFSQFTHGYTQDKPPAGFTLEIHACCVLNGQTVDTRSLKTC